MLLRALQHETIIRLLDVFPSQNEADLYLVFEFMDSDLHNANASNILEEEHKQYIIYQLLKALLFIHTSGIVHRDIKPENLLLNTSCQLKVADFGLARSLQCEGDASNYPMTEYIATRWYRAPEIVLGSTIYSKAVDMWAVGCIIAELYIGRPLFPGKSTVDQINRIMEITGRPTEQQVEEIFGGSSAHLLLEKVSRVMTRSIESHLPSANEDAIDLVKRLLQFCPKDRLTIEQTLQHPYVAKYREPTEEMAAASAVTIPLDDNEKRSVSTYRNELFSLSLRQRTEDPDESNARKTTKKKKSAKQVVEDNNSDDGSGDSKKKEKEDPSRRS
jgi:mitogen-activated protein kinase 15